MATGRQLPSQIMPSKKALSGLTDAFQGYRRTWARPSSAPLPGERSWSSEAGRLSTGRLVCGPLERDPEGKSTVLNPTLLMEVLSPSTADYDRGEKREHYQQIASLHEIVLVAQDRRWIEVHRRGSEGWSRHQAGPGETIVLTSISCRLDVDALYDRAGA